MNIVYDRFPGGVTKALTLSYDDGREQDRRMADILNRHGLKCTFHLNSGFFGREGYVRADEVRALYAGHEVSAHSVSHPYLDRVPRNRVIVEMVDDRKQLEELVRYPVRGMSYPFGSFNAEVAETLRALGFVYARTVVSHHGFRVPNDYMQWGATCHHNDRLEERFDEFVRLTDRSGLALMYVWGHSYEFDRNDNWDMFERFCEAAGRRNDIWFATNIAIRDYLEAQRALQTSVRNDIVHNPSAVPVWISVEGEAVEVAPGATIELAAR